jgi:cytochrome c5
MKWMFGRTAMWIWATVAATTVAYAAGQQALPEGDGKKILESACTSCHGIEGTVKMKLDKEGWEGIVSSMISNGAQVDQKDYPVLIDYLVKNFGTSDAAGAPAADSGASAANDAAAKKLLEDACTSCHDLGLVTEAHLTKDEWQGVVMSMVAKGATVSEKDSPVLVEYLVKMYGPNK